MILPDTSVWVDFSRRGASGEASAMRGLLDADEVVTCGPVVAELIAGADGEVAERMWEMLSSLRWAELDAAGWRQVGLTARRLRSEGAVLPLTDLMIAVATMRSGHVLWSFDRDFERIASALDGLELYGAEADSG